MRMYILKKNCFWYPHRILFSIYEEYIEFHFDLNDGKGLESQIGHCWKPNEIYNLTKYIKNKKIIEGKLIKKPNINEIKERNWRTDPSDGLRPLKKIRRKFK